MCTHACMHAHMHTYTRVHADTVGSTNYVDVKYLIMTIAKGNIQRYGATFIHH